MTHCKSCGAPYGKETASFCDYCGTLSPAPKTLHQYFDANEAALESLRQAMSEDLMRRQKACTGMSAFPAYGMSAVMASWTMSARPAYRNPAPTIPQADHKRQKMWTKWGWF